MNINFYTNAIICLVATIFCNEKEKNISENILRDIHKPIQTSGSIKRNIDIKDINFSTYEKAKTTSHSYKIIIQNVKKQNTRLCLPMNSRSYTCLYDKYPNSDNINSTEYTYKGSIPKLNIHIVKAQYFETGEFFLMNTKTGKKITLWGTPKVSLNGKRILATSSSIDYDIMPNGIQVFKIINNEIVKTIEYTTDIWAPGDAFWVDDNTIFIKRHIPAYNSHSKRDEIKYSKVTL